MPEKESIQLAERKEDGGADKSYAFANCLLFGVLTFVIWLVPLFVTEALDHAIQPLSERAYLILYFCLVLLAHGLAARFINIAHKWADVLAPAIPVAKILDRGAAHLGSLPSGGFWHSLIWPPLVPVLPLLATIEAVGWIDSSFHSIFFKILGYLLAGGFVAFCSIFFACLTLGLWPKRSGDTA